MKNSYLLYTIGLFILTNSYSFSNAYRRNFYSINRKLSSSNMEFRRAVANSRDQYEKYQLSSGRLL